MLVINKAPGSREAAAVQPSVTLEGSPQQLVLTLLIIIIMIILLLLIIIILLLLLLLLLLYIDINNRCWAWTRRTRSSGGCLRDLKKFSSPNMYLMGNVLVEKWFSNVLQSSIHSKEFQVISVRAFSRRATNQKH